MIDMSANEHSIMQGHFQTQTSTIGADLAYKKDVIKLPLRRISKAASYVWIHEN
jgi:hypothetical protein